MRLLWHKETLDHESGGFSGWGDVWPWWVLMLTGIGYGVGLAFVLGAVLHMPGIPVMTVGMVVGFVVSRFGAMLNWLIVSLIAAVACYITLWVMGDGQSHWLAGRVLWLVGALPGLFV
jgi:hypothetical protein